MIVWIIGLSGAGKTTLATELRALWAARAANTVLIDGDEVRRICGSDGGKDAFGIEDRRANGDRIVRLCAWLDRQGINVVCSILSLFEEHRRRNRETYSQYFEVFVDAPMEQLVARDSKNLYGPALRGETANVVGIDIPFEKPEHPDMVIDNSGDGLDAAQIAADILHQSGAAA